MYKYLKKKLDSNDTKVLLSNFISLIVLRGFDFLIPLITLPYIVSVIGIEKFGLINFALAFSVYFSAIIQYGFSITSTRDIARNRCDKEKIQRIYSLTLTTSTFLVAICFVLYTSIVFTFDKLHTYQELYLLTFLSMALKAIFPIWMFQGMERMKFITYLSLLSKIIFVVSLFLVIKQQEDYIYLPVLNAASAFVTLICAFIVIRFEFKVYYVMPNIFSVFQQLKYGKNAFISQFAPNLYSNTAIFALGMFTSNSVVGVFTAASKVIDVVASLAYIFSNTFFPFISRNIQKHNIFKLLMMSVGSILMVSTILISDNIVEILFNNMHGNISFNIKLLSPVILLIFMQLTFGTNYLMLIGKENIAKNITLGVSVFSLSYSLPVIYFYGIYGAIFTLIFTRLLILSFYYHNYNKHRVTNGIS